MRRDAGLDELFRHTHSLMNLKRSSSASLTDDSSSSWSAVLRWKYFYEDKKRTEETGRSRADVRRDGEHPLFDALKQMYLIKTCQVLLSGGF